MFVIKVVLQVLAMCYGSSITDITPMLASFQGLVWFGVGAVGQL
jgi:hypothetical protein